MSVKFLLDGPDGAPPTVALAHGAGGEMDSPFMTTIPEGLAAAGLTVAQEQPAPSTPNPPTTPTSVASGVPTPTPDPLGTAPQRRRAPDIEPLLAEVRRVHGLG